MSSRPPLHLQSETKAVPEMPFIASSELMKKVLLQAERAAALDFSVLISGETGTGKELIARRIHANRGKFVPIDCTVLAKELAERELFGHVRGAYTSADSDGIGLIETAHQGTAFFDEIGELPLELQSKLLRLLQEGTFRKVGSTVNLHASFRVISATNRNLKAEVHARRFREDLLYRLKVLHIKVPPLRDRPEDVSLLISHFCGDYGVVLSKPVLKELIRYSWPGNVRELINTIRRLAASTENGKVSDLPSTIYAETKESAPLSIHDPPGRSRDGNVVSEVQATHGEVDKQVLDIINKMPRLSMANMEKLMIVRSLVVHRGDRGAVCAELAIGRSTLARRIQEIQRDPQLRDLLPTTKSRDNGSVE